MKHTFQLDAQDTEEASRRYVEKRRGDLEQEVVGAGQRNFTPQNSNLENLGSPGMPVRLGGGGWGRGRR